MAEGWLEKNEKKCYVFYHLEGDEIFLSSQFAFLAECEFPEPGEIVTLITSGELSIKILIRKITYGGNGAVDIIARIED